MFDTKNDFNTINKNELSLMDSSSFFEIEVTSITYQDIGHNKKLAIINNTINVSIPSGLEGVFKKLETYKIYYKLDKENLVNFLACYKK
jgi:hypothetical protein